MAASFSNPYGAVALTDGGVPRNLTIKARETISGGWWVNGSSTIGVVSSGADSYAASDIEGYTVSTVIGSSVIGLALDTIPSGTYGTIIRRGDVILPVASGTKVGSVYAGWPVMAGSAGTVVPMGSSSIFTPFGDGVGVAPFPVARAMSTMDNTGGFIVVSLNL